MSATALSALAPRAYYVAMIGVGVGYVMLGVTLARRLRVAPGYYCNAYGPFPSKAQARAYAGLLARTAASETYPSELLAELDRRTAAERIKSFRFGDSAPERGR